MERNREGRRATTTTCGGIASVTRRPRIKETSDDEDRADETVDTRVWERSKKERLASFHTSSPLNYRNKRKRHEPHVGSVRFNAAAEDADESVEETEVQASEDDDEPPPPPLLKKPGKVRSQAKEDEIVVAVPRKARSSMSASSRYSSVPRRQPDLHPPDVSRQKTVSASQIPSNGSSSPSRLQKQGRKLKPSGPKVRPVKVPKTGEPSTLSDQEAEVAEALFDLARSIPSYTGLLESKVEVKVEAEARTCSPPAVPSHAMCLTSPGSTANGYLSTHPKDVVITAAEALKKKRPRVVNKSEDVRVSAQARLGGSCSVAVSLSASPSMPNHSCMGETEPDSLSEKINTDIVRIPPDAVNVRVREDTSYPTDNDDRKSETVDHESMEQGEHKVAKHELPTEVVETGEVPCQSIQGGEDVHELLQGKKDEPSETGLPYMPAEPLCEDAKMSRLNIDLMASPVKHYQPEEDALGSTIDKQNVGDNSSILLETQSLEAQQQDQAKNIVSEQAINTGNDARDMSSPRKCPEGEEQEGSKDGKMSSPMVWKDEDREKVTSPKTSSRSQEEVSAPFVSSTLTPVPSSSASLQLAGWMGGLPQLGYYGPGASPWPGGASLSNSGLEMKASHSTVQLPHGPRISQPLPRMKRCATHVFVAHFIYRDQQVSRHIWSAAFCRATPYNLNIPPVNILDSDKLSGHYLDAARKASAQQAGSSYGFTISQGGGQGGVTGSVGTCGVSSVSAPPNRTNNVGVSVDAGSSVTASSNVMAAHAQYIQAMNGFAASFPFPFNGPPGQAAHVFNSHFFPPHLIPPLPHLQPLPQHSSNMLPLQKQQQGLPPANTSQVVAPLHQQQLQLQLAPQSPSRSQQQHNQMGSSQQFGMHSDKDSATVAESASTAESRLTAMQRSMSAQQPSPNLPNLNISAPSLMIGTNIPGMSLQDQDGSSLANIKQCVKGQQQIQVQSSGLTSSMQPQLTPGSGTGLHFHPYASQGYSPVSKAPIHTGPSGIMSVSSMMGTPGLGVLPVSVDNIKAPAQQQPVYGGQQFQRSMTKAAVAASEDTYAGKARDYSEDKKIPMKSSGGVTSLPRVDIEVSSPSLQGSPTNGGSACNSRMSGAIGRTSASVTSSDVRNSRTSSSSGPGQPPLLQNQPQKQAVSRTKSAAVGTSGVPSPGHSVPPYERVLPGNHGKFSGTGLPYSGQIPANQGSKAGHTSVAKVGQRLSPSPAQQISNPVITKTNAQQTRTNQPAVPSTPRMIPSITAPALSAGMLPSVTPMSSSNSLSASKSSTVAANKSPSNGKGSVSATKGGLPSKKPSVSNPAISSCVSSGPNTAVRGPAQPKSTALGAHVPQFTQQQTISTQQQRLATKNQVYPQLQLQQGQFKQPFPTQPPYRPQLFLNQHQQQFMQPQNTSHQQQVSQHPQLSISHHYQSNPQSSSSQQSQTSQHLSQIPQQLQSAATQTTTGTNGLSLNSSPNLILGTNISGNLSGSASSDGGGSRMNPVKVAYTAGPLSAGIPEIQPSHSTVSGQASSPHSGSSPYLHLTSIKPNEQKISGDPGSCEDVSTTARLSSQAPAVSNPNPS
ncbi:hypothetical protein KP509_23G047200 [Ceratopteris richardii]|uniref:Protein TIME FOR COFFEE n=1 Tax=Ceratopteris richardii TaxID=49495 RepID=A0A8T2S1P5_CERRI|nr:hypothetical protein KP509_23G047200 [Ceratopteris richardii]